MLEWLLELCGCRWDATDFDCGALFGLCGGWDGSGGAAALTDLDLLLQELNQFVLILNHVATELL